MTRPMIWPVYGKPLDWTSGATMAVFFEESDAVDFVHDCAPERDMYIAEPRYDRRTRGYRPAPRPSGYQEWLASLPLVEPVSGDPFAPEARAA